MKVLEVIKIACDFTGNDEIAYKLDNSQPLSQQDNVIVNQLLQCFNLVQSEVACDYVPLIKEEKIKPVDFKVSYINFEKRPISILSAKDKFGRNVKFKAFSDYLLVFANCASIKYYYLPDAVNSLENEITEPFLPVRIFAYGVAREFLLMQNLHDDADIWEGRFKDSLQMFVKTKHDVKIPCRRWL